MKIRTIALLSVTAALLTGPAAAQAEGWYLGLGAGWDNPNNTHFLVSNGGGNGSINTRDTAAYSGAVGYEWGSGWRLELEPSYTDPKVSSGLHGDIQETSLFANLAYDIPLARWVSLTLGAGAGAAWVSPSVKTAPPVISVASGSKTAFAWQGIAGFVFPVSDNFELQADYRYQGIGDTSHNSAFFAPSNIGFKNENNQVIMLSFRWYLHEAEAAPPPPPRPSRASRGSGSEDFHRLLRFR